MEQLVIPGFEAGGLGSIVGAADTVTAFVGTAFGLITANPLLSVFVAAGLVSVGVRVWRSARRSV